MGADGQVDDEVGALYGLAAGEFVAARDVLAKRLQAGGDKDAAKAVKGLRRPTAAAWAVNQLARQHPGDVEQLLELGERLRRAQALALEGLGAGTLKELLAERRATVERLARLATGLLGNGGAAQREGIVATLEAALADPGDAEAVRAGRLAKELDAPSGFEVGGVPQAMSEMPAADRERRRAQVEVDEQRGALRLATEELDAARRERENANDEVTRLTAALDSARQRATAADERARLAERRLTQAQEELAAAEQALHDATA